MNRSCIQMPGKSPAIQRLAQRYMNLLLLHDRYRRSVATATRLPNVDFALTVVRRRLERQEMLEMRRAA